MIDLLRKRGAGKWLLRLWYQPTGRLVQLLRNGGPLGEYLTERGRRTMERAAHALPPLPPPAADTPLCVHLLTGRRFWYQTAFCLHSLVAQAGEPFRVELYDDGTIDPTVAAWLARLGPAIRLHPHAEILARLDRVLPAARFPVLRERWVNYPNIRKLTDVHAGTSGAKLVIDSDLLFFRRPEFLLGWLRSPGRILHAVDCEESYGYSRERLAALAGFPIPPLVNVGLCGIESEALDWDELEVWCRTLIAAERTNYYLEQALVAMLAARSQPCAIAPARDYLTMPSAAEGRNPTAVMHHYVATAKRSYFRHSWRLASAAPTR